MPRVDVIVPTHNRPNLLPDAVRSAKRAGRDVQVIVVDDASTDRTASVCQALDGITYIRVDHNLGVAGARNVGLLASSSEYVAFLDDDDLRLPGSLDQQCSALDARPQAGFCCGSILLADQAGELTGGRSTPHHAGGDVFWELLELAFPVIPLGVLIRKSCLLSVGLFREDLAGIDDWDMFVRIAELYPVVVDDVPVGIYRQPTHWSDQGSSRQAMHLTRAARHQRELFDLPRVRATVPARHQDARRRSVNRIADALLFDAARALSEGSFRFAAQNILAALRLSPARAIRPRAYQALWRRLRRRIRTSGGHQLRAL